jgi:hypothetical protein
LAVNGSYFDLSTKLDRVAAPESRAGVGGEASRPESHDLETVRDSEFLPVDAEGLWPELRVDDAAPDPFQFRFDTENRSELVPSRAAHLDSAEEGRTPADSDSALSDFIRDAKETSS